MTINILRNSTTVATIPIDENTIFVQKLMGEHKITAVTIVSAPLAVTIGDYIEHNGERYYLNIAPVLEKINNFTYSYTLIFEGEAYYLYNKLFLDEGVADFSYHGDPTDLLLLLLTNINSIQTGWALGTVDAAPAQTITFSNDTCRTALTKIAEAFGMEYRLHGKDIYLQYTVGVTTNLTFEYGRGKGLYTLSRNSIDNKNLVTRVYGFGARKNISTDYRSGTTRLVFEDRKLEKNTTLYGIREGVVTFEDVYPQRTGTVVETEDINTIVDTSLDFNVNEYLIEGTVAKIVFKTGALTGYEFEVRRYNHNAKSIEFLDFVEENGYTLPNTLNKPEIGDQYTLIDIQMPQTYIDAAEATLETKTQEYLDQNSTPRVTYALEIDEKYIRDNGINLQIGNIVTAIDTDLGVNAAIRVTEVSYPLVNQAQVSAVISDTIPYTTEERLIADTVDNATLTKNTDRRRAELARQSAARMRDLQNLTFDPDGYFNPENIKPQSIETLMLSVGAKSQNFGLIGVAIQPNAGGNAASLSVSLGQLVHYEINVDGLGYVWDIPGQNFTGLQAAKPYYLYAKCSKTALTGIWELSEVPRQTEDEAGQYLFNLGILYAEKDGRRDFDFTNGMTYISGDTITTGKITSLDGYSFFDLTEGKFKVGDTTSSLDWNVTTPNRLTIKGSILQTPAGEPITIPNHKGNYNSSNSYFKGDTVSYNDNTYINTTEAATIGVVPTNTSHWSLFVPGGAPGQDGNDGADGSDGATGPKGDTGAQGPQGPKGDPGADGQDGEDGSAGPSVVFRGAHSSSKLYYNNAKRVDVVIRSGVYYIYKGTNGVSASWNSANWDNFGAQFESIATNLLLAENANIGDWIIKDGRITSQDLNSIMYGTKGKIHLQGDQYGSYDDTTRLEGDGVQVTGGGLHTFQPTTSYNDDGNPTTAAIGPRATIGAKNPFRGTVSNPRYAVHGVSFYDDDEYSLGGYFTSIKSLKSYLSLVINAVRRVSGTVTLGKPDYVVICTGTSTIYLPSNPEDGRTLIIKRTGGTVTVNGNGKSIFYTSNEGSSHTLGNAGRAFMYVYDGVYWQAMTLYNN
ncbi:phage tail protein [Cellulophaga lytica]|uniref:phage tail protein n=1 Tax=Cellulophaga lytica TaxID=979 RepID=UPI003CE53BDE